MNKLIGSAYLNHWRDRMAKGPDEVSFGGRDADAQGDRIWYFLLPQLRSLAPPAEIMDYGCGYGRMLLRLSDLWPQAYLIGVDLSPNCLWGLEARWPKDRKRPTLFCSYSPPDIRVEMIFDCLVLQHVTDPDVLIQISSGFSKDLRRGGTLVLFENVSCGAGRHMLGFDESEYMALWPDLQWNITGTLCLSGEPHALMIGRAL